MHLVRQLLVTGMLLLANSFFGTKIVFNFEFLMVKALCIAPGVILYEVVISVLPLFYNENFLIYACLLSWLYTCFNIWLDIESGEGENSSFFETSLKLSIYFHLTCSLCFTAEIVFVNRGVVGFVVVGSIVLLGVIIFIFTLE